mgnify:CR=1 FL=1
MTIIQEYLKLTEELKSNYGEKSIVLMQVGSFFEVYALLLKDGSYKGSSIKEFAEINDMVISRKNICVGGQNVMMAGFGLPQLEKYVKKLQENGFTIAVYTQDLAAKNTTRSLSCIYSPGTFFNNDNFEISNNITCVWFHHSQKNQIYDEKLTIGISNIDIFTGQSVIFEYTIDFILSPSTYDNLERFISIYKPKEIILISNKELSVTSNIINYLKENSLQLHEINFESDKTSKLVDEAKKCQLQKYQQEILNKFFEETQVFMEDFYYTCIASQSFCFLLNFVNKHNPNLVKNIEIPLKENEMEKLVLANHSLNQLNILNDNRYSGKYNSILNFLNNCITIIGKRQFIYNLLNPITNINSLNNSYDITEYTLNTNYVEYLRKKLVEIKDIEKFKRKLIMDKISPRDMLFLYNNILLLKSLYKEIRKDKKIFKFIENYISEDFEEICKVQEDFIKNNFNLEKIKYIEDTNFERLNNLNIDNLCFINKNIDNNLDEKFKNCLDSKEKLLQIKNYFSDIISKYEKKEKKNGTTDYIKIHETAKMNPMLIGTNRRVNILKNYIEKLENKEIKIEIISKFTNEKETFLLNIKDLDYKVYGNNKTYIIVSNKEINNLCNFIQNSKDDLINFIIISYRNIINNFKRLTELDKNLKKNKYIDNLINLTKELDLLQNKCYLVKNYNFCKPIINYSDNSYFKAEKMRHCLIEQLNKKETYVANDLELGTSQKGILLYGTNAVGKTSLIKSIGITIIMAQAGLFVPCSSFEYFPYNYIFTRILGNDNIFKGLSTFAVEMSELRTILKFSNKNSLILGDELCSGTESSSALSIFTAGIEKLDNINCSYIFATHFHELINYTELTEMSNLKFYHMSVIYDEKTKLLIYDRILKKGIGENMYGLEVCKSLDLPQDFLNRAHELRIKYSNDILILDQKVSKYNSEKIKNLCEICKLKKGTEVHHLSYQKSAKNNYIDKEFSLNHPANLINICEFCHQNIHKENLRLKKVKTSNGYQLI